MGDVGFAGESRALGEFESGDIGGVNAVDEGDRFGAGLDSGDSAEEN